MRMINRTRSLMVFFSMSFVIFGIIVAGWATPALSEPTVYKLRMQTCDTPALLGPTTTVPAFINNVKKMSNGRIDITLYTAGQLVPTLETAKALKMGVIDMAYSNGVYFLGTIPEAWLEMTSLPMGLLKNVYEGQEVYWNRGLDEIIREGYAEHGVHYLKTIFLGGQLTYWTNKRVSCVKDLKGLKVRAYGYVNKTFEKLGATPTFIPHEEVYTALAQRAIDASYTVTSYYERFKYFEVAPYLNLPGWSGFGTMNLLVSKKVWDKLPDDLKAIMDTAATAFSSDHVQRMVEEEQSMLARSKKIGFEIVRWPEEEMQKIHQVAYSFLPEISQKGQRCAKGIEIIKDFMKERGYLK